MSVFSTLRCCVEELSDFVLHVFQLLKAQLGVGHDEDIAGRAVFIN